MVYRGNSYISLVRLVYYRFTTGLSIIRRERKRSTSSSRNLQRHGCLFNDIFLFRLRPRSYTPTRSLLLVPFFAIHRAASAAAAAAVRSRDSQPPRTPHKSPASPGIRLRDLHMTPRRPLLCKSVSGAPPVYSAARDKASAIYKPSHCERAP